MKETEAFAGSMIEMDAHEFGLHLQQGGWRMGLLVARSIEPGEGVGTNQYGLSERSDLLEGEKISAKRFAEMAGTTYSRAMRYYRAWERAAEKGKVPAPAELSPGDEPGIDWDHLPRWKSFFNPAAWEGGATGPLNLTVKLGQYGDRLLRTHKRLLYFIERELPEEKPGKATRELAGSYAAAHEAEAAILRKIEAGEQLPDAEQVRQLLDPNQFFKTA